MKMVLSIELKMNLSVL